MTRTAAVFTKTRRALEFAAARPGRAQYARQALQGLARSEQALQAGIDPALPQLAAAVHTLVGSAWLRANSDDPDVNWLHALADAGTGPGPIAVAEADEVISRVLWARFGPDQPGQQP